MRIFHYLTADLSKRNTYKAISAKQLDCNSRFLKIKLLDNGNEFTVESNTEIVAAVKRNEVRAYKCSFEDGYVIMPLSTWVLSESGYVDCEIILLGTATNTKLSSFSFSLDVEQNIYNDETITTDDNYDLLLSLIQDVKGSQIISITEAIDGLKHNYTVTFGNGATEKFTISDGERGLPGPQGEKGADGKDGKDGYTPIKGVDYFDGAKGEKGDKGDKGDKGEQGLKGDKGEQGIQGLPGANGKDGVDGKNATINGKNAVEILGGDNVSIEQSGDTLKISASCVMQPLDLSSYTKNNPLLITSLSSSPTDTVKNAYIITKQGYIATSGGKSALVGNGSELLITWLSIGGKATLCCSVQNGYNLIVLTDEMSESDSVINFLSTNQIKTDISQTLTDRQVLGANYTKALFEQKISKSEIGDGLKFADGKLTLDIPVATADTGYGG